MGSIYILPTRSWIVLIAVLLAMWYAAVSQSNSAAYLLMFFLASVVVVTAYHAHFALAGLSLKTGRVPPVFAGETVHVPVEILNPSGRARWAIQVAAPGSVFTEARHAAAGMLPGRGSASVDLLVPSSTRGLHRVKRVALTTLYPMGFFRSWRYQPTDATSLVYPAPRGELPMPSGPAVTAEITAGSGRGGDDYVGGRNYRTGESQRHVDWRAVARGQPLMIKQFAGAGSRRLWFDEAELTMLGSVEARLSQLARWIVDAESEGYSYGLRVAEFTAEPGRGPAHYHRCLEALALAFALPDAPLKRFPF